MMGASSKINLINLFFLSLAGICLLGLVSSAEDLQFTAAADRTTLSLTETLTLTLTIQGAGFSVPDPKLPDLSDFRVLSGPNESSSFQFINGRTSSSKTFSFVLSPQREGTLTIGPAELTYKNKIYRTEPISFTVTNSSSAPPTSSTPNSPAIPPPRTTDITSDLFVQASADKNQAYQNEQVVLTYTLYTKIAVNTYEISKLPGTHGFWVEEFPNPPNGPEVRDIVIGGQHYRAAVVRRVALFPTQTGELNVDPLELSCQVQVYNQQRRSRDPFDMLFDSPFSRYRTEERIVRSEPFSLKVLPLPQEGKPANFSGAVGNFQLNVSLDRQEVKTNEALTMTVRFSGTGNVKMLPKPDFRAPADFESYDPRESVQVDKSSGRIAGAKTYEYLLIPRFAGQQKIPPLSFSFFNPATRSYQTRTEGGFVIPVGQGNYTPTASLPRVSKEDVKLLGQDIHYIKPVGKLLPLTAATHLPLMLQLGMILPPILVILLLVGARLSGMPSWQARRQGRRTYARAQAQIRSLGKLTLAKMSDNDLEKRFYGVLHHLLLLYLGEKLSFPALGLKEEDVLESLASHFPEERLEVVKNIFHTCNFARFAPGRADPGQREQLLRETQQLLEALEQNWGVRSPVEVP